jgi:hypothetical protein|tara:strand:+ start:555 stop:665 length:111 start_codon:yes stop_codon:yes gene_type:complete
MMEDRILLKTILDLVKENPNDMELGKKVREIVSIVK